MTESTIPAVKPVKNDNKPFNLLAKSMGIEVGTTEWTKGGLNANSGQTGNHPAYGWKHTHLLNDAWVKAVIANYGARRCYYTDAPKRFFAYENGGRPIGWVVEDIFDLSSGQVNYVTSKGIVKVSGPDILHFHMGPLVEVFDANSAIIFDGMNYSGRDVAGLMMHYLIASLVGQVRGANMGLLADRAIANVLKAAAQAFKRKLITDEDAGTLLTWLETKVFPYYEKSPGFVLDTHSKDQTIQLYNGLYWMLPALYDAALFLPPQNPLADRAHAMLARWSMYMKDLVAQAPKGLTKLGALKVNATMLEKPTAPLSWKLAETDFIYLDSPWEVWSYRALRVAAKILADEPSLLKAAQDIRSTHTGDQEWFVDAYGEYVLS